MGDFKIRKASKSDAYGIAYVHIKSWQSTYKDLVSQEFLLSMDQGERTERWKNILEAGESHLYVALNVNDEIVGFVSGAKEREGKYEADGELYAIYILENYQGKGIGKALTKRLMNLLKEDGFRSMLVWVLKDNSATYFYERMGGKCVDKEVITIAADEFEEVAYELLL
ncbi:GNAT family N-acetyltransferase [Halalkalibacillus sediminis]|uniref:GNAT family N-acetyltransferase n=1 Tax=Halalkalibacillus sediminis TaxID=2018042 RepID=A0A2I0QVT2_9BACI|nr:GNAT family N-acetyltransferase [Halalkalibacillus sediminis]PKR78436.1 GNAT family N-acetyltransferase [Halalkalibacillus sediminis]